ncbi:elongation of very long chain fatty acids protein 4-like [Uranotaenia lowii]|uniref:elongation of very long chain fatty acids protein 4-like n=1 Tax=Uranotaenia lowii TaxID=190385 RepID=UPI002478AC4F|nr:elongation of very long chain fatty acids protein 4-like [Uranotaenia lowii]
MSIYKHVFDDLADKRTDKLPFMQNPIWLVAAVLIYFGLIYLWIPRFMKYRKPYELRYIMIGYNAFQVIACTLLVRHFFKHGWSFTYLYTCVPGDYSNNPSAVGFMYGAYFNFLLKGIELLDTVLFGLRKKQSQISFLHVYHHSCTLICAWIFTKYFGGSMMTYTIIVNSIVHIFMYSYYLLAIFAQQLPFKLTAVKKFITVIQIAQLISILVNVGFAMRKNCPIPSAMVFIYLPFMVVLLSLFFNFYFTTYRRPKRELASDSSATGNQTIDTRKDQ